jgi:hypothetical protein
MVLRAPLRGYVLIGFIKVNLDKERKEYVQ